MTDNEMIRKIKSKNHYIHKHHLIRTHKENNYKLNNGGGANKSESNVEFNAQITNTFNLEDSGSVE